MRRRDFLVAAAVAAVSTIAVPKTASSATRRVPAPIAGLVTRWDVDPFARGAYSALAPGVRPSVRRVLANAILGDRIVFAGEYASSSHPSTTTGAYESGRYAAQRVLEHVEPRTAIVVGAGMAGAAAASVLMAAGINVVVLEARDRVGGRIHSDDRWGAPVELGAAWVHGVKNNPIAQLARAQGLALVPSDYEDSTVRDTVTGRYSAAGEAAQQEVTRLLSRLEVAWPPVSMNAAKWMRQRGWRNNRFGSWAAETEITQEYGLSPKALGVRGPEEGKNLRGGDAFVGGGYGRIPAALLAGANLRLSTAVSAVTSSGDSAIVSLVDGSQLSADAVVVAVPVSILRSGAMAITPMSREVKSAINSLVTGDLEKVILRYDEEWWPDYTVFGVVGGGAPGAPAGSLAALRWTEFYPLTNVLGFPALVGFSGGAAALSRPSTDAGCITEALAALNAAFARA